MEEKTLDQELDQTPETAPEEELSTGRKIWEWIKRIFTGLVMVAAVAMMLFTIISVTTFDRNDRDLFGYKAFIVRSDSMSKTDFSAGDLILVKEADPSTVQPGDIITFRSEDPNSFGEVNTHKVRRLTTTEDGAPAFITYGTTTDTDDLLPVAYHQILGVYRYTLPKVGTFFAFLKTVPGYVCCILLPFLLLIVLQGINSIKLFRQYKAEQMAELEEKHQKELDAVNAEREKLAAERAESERMLAELQRLHAELAAKNKEE